MEGLVTLLDKRLSAQVEAAWDELHQRCGIEHPIIGPAPHFSWHVAWAYDLPELEPALRKLAASQPVFRLNSTGLGLFSGSPQWVLYIPVIKTREMIGLHARLWKMAERFAERAVPYYMPAVWQPHITLAMLPAHEDDNGARLGQAVELFAGRSFDWEIRVDNLAVLSESEGRCFHIPFGGKQ